MQVSWWWGLGGGGREAARTHSDWELWDYNDKAQAPACGCSWEVLRTGRGPHPEAPRHLSSIFRPRAWPSEGREGFQAESESEFPGPGLSPGRSQRSPREAAPIFLQRPLLAPGADLSLGRSGAWKVRLGEA